MKLNVFWYIGGGWLGFSLAVFTGTMYYDWELYVVILPAVILFRIGCHND